MNRKYQHLEYSDLLDELAKYTAVYTKLLNENGSSEDKDRCRQMIQRLIAEINIRESEDQAQGATDQIIK